VIVALRMGLFKTEDAGNTWRDTEVGRFSPTTYGRDIKVLPRDGNSLHAALSVAAASKDGAIYLSTDMGGTWKRFDKVQIYGTIMSVALHATDPDRVFIGARYDGEIHGTEDGTEDGGATWQALPLPPGLKGIYSVAIG
jgi:photosystem II stability/assembly factor-like uncharacterized protein